MALDDAGEREIFREYLESLATISPIVKEKIEQDPANDNFIYFDSDNLEDEFGVPKDPVICI